MKRATKDLEAELGLPDRARARWAALRLLAVGLACMGAGLASGVEPDANSGAGLRAQYGALRSQLTGNQFQRPFHLNSSETTAGVAGSIHALIDHPFASTSAALGNPQRWCDILILHLNTKFCRASSLGAKSGLQVNVGTKHEQRLKDTYQVDFAYRVAATNPDFLKVTLFAEEGPLSTYDYAISLEAAPLDAGRTVIHLEYSYGYGFAGRLAMQTYLATVGSGKAGFTVTGKQADGRAIHIGGMRGLVERNTMRYYLAIEALLGALSAPPQDVSEKSQRDWFAATELYPRQLHELEQGEYLAMKRSENLRMIRGID
jgi:hypothetical protein